MVLKIKGQLVPHVLIKCQLIQAPCDQVLLTDQTRHTDRRDLKALDGQRSKVKGHLALCSVIRGCWQTGPDHNRHNTPIQEISIPLMVRAERSKVKERPEATRFLTVWYRAVDRPDQTNGQKRSQGSWWSKIKGHLVPQVLSRCQLIHAQWDHVLLSDQTRPDQTRPDNGKEEIQSFLKVKGQRPFGSSGPEQVPVDPSPVWPSAVDWPDRTHGWKNWLLMV